MLNKIFGKKQQKHNTDNDVWVVVYEGFQKRAMCFESVAQAQASLRGKDFEFAADIIDARSKARK